MAHAWPLRGRCWIGKVVNSKTSSDTIVNAAVWQTGVNNVTFLRRIEHITRHWRRVILPIIRIGLANVFFAHVPKCGGASVEKYLESRFGAVSFYDGAWWKKPRVDPWVASSPQHATANAIDTLFAPGFFDHSFGVVRHPTRRVISAFVYNRNMRRIPWHWSISRLLSEVEKDNPAFHLRTDNHFRPMTHIIGKVDRIFRIESDEAALIGWLDDLAGSSDGPRALPHANKSAGGYLRPRNDLKHAIKSRLQPAAPVEGDSSTARIEAIYGEDFSTFEYDRLS